MTWKDVLRKVSSRKFLVTVFAALSTLGVDLEPEMQGAIIGGLLTSPGNCLIIHLIRGGCGSEV